MFVRGWKESLAANQAQQKKIANALKKELRNDERDLMSKEIAEYTQAKENIEKMLAALK